ncbi:MAG: IS256 family transposase [Calditrichaeota bacterium]|nr:IS256 family transposase [Calditrichota bacterium]
MAQNTQEVKLQPSEIQEVLMNEREFLRQIVQEGLQQILESEFEEFIGAAPHERTQSRRGYRNGRYSRKLKTRVGTIELEVLRDRAGEFSTELFARYQRSEQAFVGTLLEMYLQGVSTRKVKRVVEQLCGESLSRSTVSNLVRRLDETLKRWRERRLEGEYPYLVIDARYEDIRDNGVVKSKAVLLVVGIKRSGYREVLSVEIGDSESYESWRRVFQGLKERGLRGVKYAVSDEHKGLVQALKQEFYDVSWQRCQVHFLRNFLGKFSRREGKEYVKWLQDIFGAPEIETARERKRLLVEKLISAKKDRIADWLDEEIEACFTVYSLPESHRRRMRSTNMLERLNQEIRRRSQVVRIFPNEASCLRLVSALCMEYSEEWLTGYKYLDMDSPKEEEEPSSTHL